MITLQKAEMGYRSWQKLLASEEPDKTFTSYVFLKIKLATEQRGCVGIGLYGKVVPKTVENFRALCTGEKVFL